MTNVDTIDRDAASIPTTMLAVVIDAFGDVAKLHLERIPVPATAADEVLVRVRAAGVGIWDVKQRTGAMAPKDPQFPLVLGAECSGELAIIGESVERDDLKVGTAVYTYFTGRQGGYAQFVNVKADAVAPKPERLSFVEAAAAPVDAVTAYQGISEYLQIKAGETIFIAGASGGVGTMAVQLARNLGAKIIASAGTENLEYVRSLGAHDVVDYTAGDVDVAVRRVYPEGVDAAFDCVGGASAQVTVRAVRDAGRFIDLTGENVGQQRGIAARHVQSKGTAQRLRILAAMFDAGSLRVVVDRIYPLPDARSAQDRVAGEHGPGKIVLELGGPDA